METVTDFIFLGSKITADGDCSHEIKRHLPLGRKVMTNLDSILKSRAITFRQGSIESKKEGEVAQLCPTLSDPMDCWETVDYRPPGSSFFFRQEYWSGLSFPSPGDLPDPGIEPGSVALQADALLSEPPGKP